MKKLSDRFAEIAKEMINKEEKERIEASRKLKLDSDTICPECEKEMKDTTVSGLPAKACFDCRIALPSASAGE